MVKIDTNHIETQSTIYKKLIIESEASLDNYVIPDDARHAIATKYIEQIFGRGIHEFNDAGDSPLMEAIRKADEASVFMLLLSCGRDEFFLDEQNQFGQTALCLAVEIGKESIVKLLIEKGADLNKKGQFGCNPLHLAIEEGNVSLVSLILCQEVNSKQYVRLDEQNEFGDTALHLAAESGNKSIVSLLLKRGVDVNAQRQCGCPALNLAIDRQNESIILLLIKNGADVNNATCSTGDTAMHLAVKGGNRFIVNMLLEQGAFINEKNGHDNTPLHIAAQYGHESIVELLLHKTQLDIDINATNLYGETALHIAENYMHRNEKYISIVHILLERGLGLICTGGSGVKALQYAARKGHNHTVKLLMEKGVDVNGKDEYSGLTALDFAAKYGNESIVQLLLDEGGAVENITGDGCMSMQYAAEKGHTSIVRLIMEKGVANHFERGSKNESIDQRTKYTYWGPTLIHLSLQLSIFRGKGFNVILQVLLEKKGMLAIINNARDLNGQTSLHIATELGNKYCVHLLLKHGVDVNIKDFFGQTALSIATQNGYKKITKLLLRYGAAKTNEMIYTII